MKIVPLNNDYYMFIDNTPKAITLYERYHWRAHKDKDGSVYACARIWLPGNRQKRIRFHRELVGAAKGQLVDHRNHDTLDNQEHNLRKCNDAQSTQSRRPFKGRKFKGVNLHSQIDKWWVRVKANKQSSYLGCFNDLEDALLAYNREAALLHGEFAVLNDLSDREAIKQFEQEARARKAERGPNYGETKPL